MKVQSHPDVVGFFATAQTALELNEAANSVILGVGRQLERYPERYVAQPILKTVSDGPGLVLAAMMTPPQHLLAFAHRGDHERAARLLAEDLADEGLHVPGVMAPTETARLVAGAWASVTGGRTEIARRQRVFELRQVLIPSPERGELRQATAADVGLVARWWHRFNVDVFDRADRAAARRTAEVRVDAGDVYLWVDVWPVSMAVTTRPTRHGISVGGVYTPPDLRNRGYATACVGELSRRLIDSGWSYCSLFADLRNAAANKVYERIGYQPLCEYAEILFGNQ
jgi:predicted GNAT family acetyltransferase